MAPSAFSFPKQWEDWTSWGLGIWLVLSPWALFFDPEPRAMENAVAVGALIIIVEIVELSIFRDWEEWINVALGAWLAISPWALGIANSAARKRDSPSHSEPRSTTTLRATRDSRSRWPA